MHRVTAWVNKPGTNIRDLVEFSYNDGFFTLSDGNERITRKLKIHDIKNLMSGLYVGNAQLSTLLYINCIVPHDTIKEKFLLVLDMPITKILRYSTSVVRVVLDQNGFSVIDCNHPINK